MPNKTRKAPARRESKYAWSTGIQFPSRLLDNTSAIRLSETAPKDLTNAFNKALRAYTR
jgi:hypothetical protein